MVVVKYFYGTFPPICPLFPAKYYYVELPGGAFDIKEVLTVDRKLMIQKDPTILWRWLKPRRLWP